MQRRESSDTSGESEDDGNVQADAGSWGSWSVRTADAEVVSSEEPEDSDAGVQNPVFRPGSSPPRWEPSPEPRYGSPEDSNWWQRQRHQSLRKRLLSAAKAGNLQELSHLFAEYGADVLLSPTVEQGREVGPELSPYAVARMVGHHAVAELLSGKATELLINDIQKMLWSDHHAEHALVYLRHRIQDGANLCRGTSHGELALLTLCQLETKDGEPISGHSSRAVQIERLARLLVEHSPTTLVAADSEGRLPLEVAASNSSIGHVLVPALCEQVGSLLLRHVGISMSLPMQRATKAAFEKFPGFQPVSRLKLFMESVENGLEGRTRSVGKPPLAAAYEDWHSRQRRLDVLEPLMNRVGASTARCIEGEAQARVAELEILLEARRAKHEEQVAELTRALDRAQRAAEASRQAEEASRRTMEAAAGGAASITDDSGAAGRPDVASAAGADKQQRATSSKAGLSNEADVIRAIRRQRGLDLDVEAVPAAVQESLQTMQRSIGAAVERLARDLYTSRGHFILELLQNADDNHYGQDVVPSLSFSMGCTATRSGHHYLVAFNNELGMTSQDVEALCDVNRSTKGGSAGRIGRKGVGWKSVFAVSDQPVVMSGAFRFCFDVRRLGRLGYVTPSNLSDAEFAELMPADLGQARNTGTMLLLPLHGGCSASGCSKPLEALSTVCLVRSCAERLFDCPAWLPFLRRLRRIEWEDRGAEATNHLILERHEDVLRLRRCLGDQAPEEVELRFWVHRKTLQTPPDLAENGNKGGEEEVVIAIEADAVDEEEPNEDALQPASASVFCFLPVRAVGFRFLLHAPWTLTSNREDWHLEDPRNGWLRDEAAVALAEALTRYSVELGARALTMLDARQVLDPFWRRLLEKAAEALGDADIIPIEGRDGPGLAKPSEVLVPPSILTRCPAALRFLKHVPVQLWHASTGKHLAALSRTPSRASEESRRLQQLKVKTLGVIDLSKVLQCDECKPLLATPERLGELLELLAQFIRSPAENASHDPDQDLAGGLSMADIVHTIQTLHIIPLSQGCFVGDCVFASLGDGPIYLPGAAPVWCAPLDETTCERLCVHRGVRVIDRKVWLALPMPARALLQQLGLREAALPEVAAAVVRQHALHLSEGHKIQSFAASFTNGLSDERDSMKVFWAGLEAVRVAHSEAMDAMLDALRSLTPASSSTAPPPSSSCMATSMQRTPEDAGSWGAPGSLRGGELPGAGARLDSEALGLVLWLPCTYIGDSRKDDDRGPAWFARAVSLRLPSLLGIALSDGGEAPNFADMIVPEEFEGDSELRGDPRKWKVDLQEMGILAASKGKGPGAHLTEGTLKKVLCWEAFFAELGCQLPGHGDAEADMSRIATTCASSAFWELLSRSLALRKHACRILREFNIPLSEAKVPSVVPGGLKQPLRSHFRRSVFEPLVGAGGLPFIDAPDTCAPLLELLQVPARHDFECLAAAMEAWTQQSPPAVYAPKELCNALVAAADVAKTYPRTKELQARLRKCIFIPGRGAIQAENAVWQAPGSMELRVCELSNSAALAPIYGEALKPWFCGWLGVSEGLGVYQLVVALMKVKELAMKPSTAPKVTLSMLRQVYARLANLAAPQVVEEQDDREGNVERPNKRPRREASSTGSATNAVQILICKTLQERALIVLPQASRGQRWKFLRAGDAFWSVDEEIEDLPCSCWALKNFYGEESARGAVVGLKHFFVNVVQVPETLRKQDLIRRLGGARLAAAQEDWRRALGLTVDEGQEGIVADDADDNDETESDAGGVEEDFSLIDLVGDDTSILGPDILVSRRMGAGGSRSALQGPDSVDAVAEEASIRAQAQRAVHRTRGARAVQSAGVEELSLRRLDGSYQGIFLYVCGSASLLSSSSELSSLGVVSTGRPGGPLHATQDLAKRAEGFAGAVLRPLTTVFELPRGCLAACVGQAIGRGRNIRGLICLPLDRFTGAAHLNRSERSQWFCEACRLLAENSKGEGFPLHDLTAAITARHMDAFLRWARDAE